MIEYGLGGLTADELLAILNDGEALGESGGVLASLSVGGGGNLTDRIKARATGGAAAVRNLTTMASNEWGSYDYGAVGASSSYENANDDIGGLTVTSGTTIGNFAAIQSGDPMPVQGNPATTCCIKASGTTTDIRIGVALQIDSTGSTFLAFSSDAPAGGRPTFGLIYSDDASDTNWMIVTSDGAGNVTRASTGVAYDKTKAYELAIAYNANGTGAPSVKWEITNLTDGSRTNGSTSADVVLGSAITTDAQKYAVAQAGLATLTAAARTCIFQAHYFAQAPEGW